jgi:ABC-2 type transport system permease protein
LRYYASGWHGPGRGYDPSFAEFTIVFNLIANALVPFTALVYASGLIQDEIEEQTITYLLIRPLPRWSIYLAKLLATLIVTAGLAAAFTALTYVVVGWGQPDYWASGALARMFKTIALFVLSLTAYDALFGLLSMLMRRAIILGIGYIILLEMVVANIDFVIRKGTVMYYFRVMCERWMHISEMSQVPGMSLTFFIDFDTAPSLRACLMTLSLASAVLIALACYLMSSREFRVKTPEGS